MTAVSLQWACDSSDGRLYSFISQRNADSSTRRSSTERFRATGIRFASVSSSLINIVSASRIGSGQLWSFIILQSIGTTLKKMCGAPNWWGQRRSFRPSLKTTSTRNVGCQSIQLPYFRERIVELQQSFFFLWLCTEMSPNSSLGGVYIVKVAAHGLWWLLSIVHHNVCL